MKIVMASSNEIMKPTVKELLSKPKAEILSFLGTIYEHSPWIAEAFYEEHLEKNNNSDHGIENVNQLYQSMASVLTSSSTSSEQKLALLRAHPDLCAKIDQLKSLTQESQTEQSRAGLGSLTDQERETFGAMNEEYKSKFQFPFILAARNATKYTILSAIEGRISRSVEQEFAGALIQVNKIAWMRLIDKLNVYESNKGFLTCHVLDTAQGCPASRMRITLHRLTDGDGDVDGDNDNERQLVKTFITNEDGRLEGGPALKGAEFQVGMYEWTFYVGDYFARSNIKMGGVPFLKEVPLRFGIDNPEEHYHVPLLVSPWSYSTYRGS